MLSPQIAPFSTVTYLRGLPGYCKATPDTPPAPILPFPFSRSFFLHHLSPSNALIHFASPVFTTVCLPTQGQRPQEGRGVLFSLILFSFSLLCPHHWYIIFTVLPLISPTIRTVTREQGTHLKCCYRALHREGIP